MTGANKGLESDRLLIEWELESERVQTCCAGEQKAAPPPGLARCIEAGAGNPHAAPLRIDLSRTERQLLVPIPAGFARRTAADLPLARAWRMATRAVMDHYLRRGYAVVDFHMDAGPGDGYGYYRLARGSADGDDHL